MPLKKWRSMDIFNFSPRDSPLMESVTNKFAQISQSHAGSLLRSRRLGSLSSVKSDESITSPKREDSTDSSPLLNRIAIIQKDEKGYGLTVSGDNPVYVASVKAGGAAERAGVQVDDRIVKVNGKHVTNSNHKEVVHLIRAGSYVALTLLGKPSSSGHNTNRESTIEEGGSFRNSITAPIPVDPEKEKDFRQQKANTLRVMYDAAHEDYDKLKKAHKSNPTDKLQLQITEKEKTLKILEAQLQGGAGHQNSIRESQGHSLNVDDTGTSDNTSVSSWLHKKERKHMKHSSSPGAMYRPSESQSKASVNVCRSKSDVSSRKNTLSEYPSYGSQGFKQNDLNPEVTGIYLSTGKKVKKSSSFKGFKSYARKKSRADTLGRKVKPKKGLRKTASVPSTVSDRGSDSAYTSPSSSPTPTQSTDTDTLPGDSEHEDIHQNQMSKPNNIIGMDDDEFPSEDECSDVDRRTKPSSFLSKLQNYETGDSKVFSDLAHLESKPAHMAIFLHYVLNHHNPSSLLFHMMSGFYASAPGNAKDLKKWAYEIHSTFLVHQAPLKVKSVQDYMVQEIDSNLQFKAEKEDVLRAIFSKSRTAANEEVQKLLEDLRQKKEQGLIEGSSDLKDQMDKGEEQKIVERYVLPDLENIVQKGETDEKYSAQSWAIATFLRHTGLHKSSSSHLERVQSFVTKDKRSSKFIGKKSKSIKGHQFSPAHLSKQEFCLHCNRVLWGVGFQGYQCQTCDQCVHKLCIDELDEPCSKSKRKRVTSSLNVFKPKQQGKATSPTQPVVEGGAVKSALSDIISAATPIISDSERDPVISPTQPSKPNVFTQPLKEAEDAEINAFRDSGHSVNNLVNRFETKSPERETASSRARKSLFNLPLPFLEDIRQGRRTSRGLSTVSLPPRTNLQRKNDIGRSESMKGRGDQRDRPTRRSKSDVDVDENTLRIINSGSSSASSLRSVESPSNSMDTLTAQINEDSDFDVESELPSLKQVLGEETVRKLKPKEKKRQDVINELFYTEKCHVRNLKILDKLFYRPMLKEPAILQEFTKSLFPNIETMISLHGSLNNSMKQRRKEKTVISAVGDLLVARFDGKEGENFRTGCAMFCRNQSHALENLKSRTKKETKMAQLLCDAENNPLCQRLALKDIIPKQFMRLTKYPLLIENLLKYTPTNTEEYTNLEHAQRCSKHILEYVNQAVKDCENHQRLIDLQRRIDKKAIDGSSEMEDLRAFDLSRHKLIHDGTLTWRINNRKQIELHVVLLEKAMVLLQKQEERLVLKLQSTQLVAGKEDTKRQSPLLWLNNVLARNDATDKKAFFVVNTSKAGPQIYQLVAGTADEQKRWTKYITQAADSMKKNEINSKNKKLQQQPVQEEIPVPPPAEQEMPEPPPCLELQPDDVNMISNDQVISPLEKLRQNDEDLAGVLETRIRVLAEFLKVNPDEVAEKTQEIASVEGSDPAELVLACQHQITELMDLIKDNSIGALQQHNSDEQVESIEDLSLPIPMERLKDMANRMNQILTNLLAQTRANSTALSPVSSQAAVNSRDEERDRLRRELSFAQDELNRLRRIQKIQLERNMAKAKEQEAEEGQQSNRPVSIVSETSTLSESEPENKDESEVTSEMETDTNEDGMPGLPIDPEVVTEISSEILNEVSPVTIETLPDMESPIPTEESVAIEQPEYENEEQMLHEVEPPDEDQLEDLDVPGLKIVRSSDDSDSDSDQSGNEKDNDEEDESVSDTGDTVTNVPDDDQDADPDLEEQTGAIGATLSEDASSRLQGEVDTNGVESDDNNGKRDSGEIFHDAVDGTNMEIKTNIDEDPGGQEVEKVEPDPTNSCDVDTATISKHSDTNNSDPDNNTQVEENITKNNSETVAPVIENNNVETQSDGNVDCNTDPTLIPAIEGDKNGNNTETSLDDKNSATNEAVTSLTDKEKEAEPV